MLAVSRLLKSFITKHHRRLREQGRSPRRFYIEAGVTAVVLAGLLLLVTLITPYDPKLESVEIVESNQEVDSKYYRAKIDIVTENDVYLKMLDGPQAGTATAVQRPTSDSRKNGTEYKPGDTVIVTNTTMNREMFIIDHYRLPMLAIFTIVFIGLVLLVGGRQGAASLVGLGITAMVIGWLIVPFILSGHNPLLICVIGAYIIALASITIAHGLKRRTFVAVGCVVIVLTLVAILSQLAVVLMNFTGLIDEIVYIFNAERPDIDMRGVLTGGIIIASLGVLDDIVTAQVATVDELQKANKKLDAKELFLRASSVGREHVSALVNTLALVYVGASLPIVIALTTSIENGVMFINNEYIATEIARTLVASIGLVLAVPVATAIAAVYFHTYRKSSKTGGIFSV